MSLWTLNGKLLVGPNGGLSEDPKCCVCNTPPPPPVSPCCCTDGVNQWCFPETLYWKFTRTGDWTPSSPEDCQADQWANQSGTLSYQGLTTPDNYPWWQGLNDCGDIIGFVCFGMTYNAVDGTCTFSGELWFCDYDAHKHTADLTFKPLPPDNEPYYIKITDSLIGDCCCIGNFFELEISTSPISLLTVTPLGEDEPEGEDDLGGSPYPTTPQRTHSVQSTQPLVVHGNRPISSRKPGPGYYSPPGMWLRKQLTQMGMVKAAAWCINDFRTLDNLEPGWWAMQKNQDWLLARLDHAAKRANAPRDPDTLKRLIRIMAHRAQRFQ